MAASPQVPPDFDDEDEGPISEAVWFNAFGLPIPHDARYAAGFFALGYEAVMNPYQAWSIDLRRDAYGGTLGPNANAVRFAGIGFGYRFFPQAHAPTGLYLALHGALGYGSYITENAVPAGSRTLHDGGALQAGATAGYSWTLWKHLQLRAGLGASMLCVPDLHETVVAGGLTGDLQVGYQF